MRGSEERLRRRQVLQLTLSAMAVPLAAACASQTPSTAPTLPSAPTGDAPGAPAPPSASPVASPSRVAAAPSPASSPGASPAANPSPTGAVTHVVQSIGQVSGSNIPQWLASDQGIFQANGLDVTEQLASGGVNALDALVAGDVQFGQQGPEILSAMVGGAKLVIVATPVALYQFKFYAQPDVTTVDDLKGKTVDIRNFGSSVDVATRVGLRMVGLDPDTDVNYVATGSLATGLAALANGAVAGGMITISDAPALEALGLHQLFDMAQLKAPFASAVVAVQQAYLEANRPVVQSYVDSLVQAIALARKDRALTVDVLKNHFNSTDDNEMGATYDFYIGEGVIPALPFPKPEQFTDAIGVLSQTNPAVTSFDLSSVLDASFVQSAVDRHLDQ